MSARLVPLQTPEQRTAARLAEASFREPAPRRYVPVQPRAPRWLPGQGWFVLLLAAWNLGWPAYLVVTLWRRYS